MKWFGNTWLAAVVFSVVLCGCGQHHAYDKADLALLRGWISTIGSDEFGGRCPMTEYEDKTIGYLASEMENLGLEPAFDGEWFQNVGMITTISRPDDGKIHIQGQTGDEDLLFGDDMIFWTARATDRIELKDCGFVFAGFGIEAPEYGWNDLEGVDVKDKIIVAMVNDPGFYNPDLFKGKNMTYYGRFTYKFELAERLGAAGCLVVHNTAAASYGWDVLVNGHLDGNRSLFDEQTRNAGCMALKGWIHEEGCRKLLAAAGLDFDQLSEDAKKPGFRAIDLNVKGDVLVDVTYETAVTRNVAGVMPGTDLKDESIVFSAHWDHFGTGTPDDTGDAIYNGASDNGSGIAAILLIAKKFKDMPKQPRRSLVFLIPTLEESGLYGSQFYCEHPALPIEKTLACFNFDCIAPEAYSEDLVLLGGGQSNLDDYISASAAAQGRHVVFDDDNSDGWYFRSDHYNFVKKGVPALVMENGNNKTDWYHKPSDEYSDDWDMSGTISDINVMFGAAAAIAEAPDRLQTVRRNTGRQEQQ